MTDNPYRLMALLVRNISKSTKTALLGDLKKAYDAAKIGSRERVELALMLQYVETNA